MSGKIVEGVWNCSYCGADKIGGLQKYCPNCGHPQDKNTKFYMGPAKRYLTEEEMKNVGTDPDWLCEYCGTLSNAKYQYCKNCGAERTSENKDYFEMQDITDSSDNANTNYNTEQILEDWINATEGPTTLLVDDDKVSKTATNIETLQIPKKTSINWLKLGKYIGIGALVVFAIIGLIHLFTPREYEAVIAEKTWERDVVIQEYRTVEESAWDRVPSGGRLLYTTEEIRSYNQVFSHYETKTRQVATQVFDGYDTYTYYTDNGNGTFTEHTSQTPRYHTEYVTETYQEPVYISVPVYDTKYHYEIERWVYDRTEESKGSNNEPY